MVKIINCSVYGTFYFFTLRITGNSSAKKLKNLFPQSGYTPLIRHFQ